jgi:hypothetical protein
VLSKRDEQDPIVIRGRHTAAVAVRGQNEEFAARYLEHVA